MALIAITFKVDTRSPYLDEFLSLVETIERTAKLEKEAAALAPSVSPSSPDQGNQYGNH